MGIGCQANLGPGLWRGREMHDREPFAGRDEGLVGKGSLPAAQQAPVPVVKAACFALPADADEHVGLPRAVQGHQHEAQAVGSLAEVAEGVVLGDGEVFAIPGPSAGRLGGGGPVVFSAVEFPVAGVAEAVPDAVDEVESTELRSPRMRSCTVARPLSSFGTAQAGAGCKARAQRVQTAKTAAGRLRARRGRRRGGIMELVLLGWRALGDGGMPSEGAGRACFREGGSDL